MIAEIERRQFFRTMRQLRSTRTQPTAIQQQHNESRPARIEPRISIAA